MKFIITVSPWEAKFIDGCQAAWKYLSQLKKNIYLAWLSDVLVNIAVGLLFTGLFGLIVVGGTIWLFNLPNGMVWISLILTLMLVSLVYIFVKRIQGWLTKLFKSLTAIFKPKSAPTTTPQTETKVTTSRWSFTAWCWWTFGLSGLYVIGDFSYRIMSGVSEYSEDGIIFVCLAIGLFILSAISLVIHYLLRLSSWVQKRLNFGLFVALNESLSNFRFKHRNWLLDLQYWSSMRRFDGLPLPYFEKAFRNKMWSLQIELAMRTIGDWGVERDWAIFSDGIEIYDVGHLVIWFHWEKYTNKPDEFLAVLQPTPAQIKSLEIPALQKSLDAEHKLHGPKSEKLEIHKVDKPGLYYRVHIMSNLSCLDGIEKEIPKIWNPFRKH